MGNMDVGIVLINYNNYKLTIEAVKSIIYNTAPELRFQIIIIDNASDYEDYTSLLKWVNGEGNGRVNLIRSVINTGFGGGNMMGVQHINAKYYAFINNDSILQNDCLSLLNNFMDDHTDVAISAPDMLDEKMERKIGFDHFVSVQREIFGSSFLEWINPKKYPNRKATYDKPLAVNYVNGSFMFCRAKDFDDVGGFDTNIFLFFEESDLCYRLYKRGKSTFFVPEAKYVHLQGKSMPHPTTTKIELKTSMFYVIRKHSGYLSYQFLRLVFILRYGLTSLVKPKYFSLFIRILIGLPLSKSIKNKQKIVRP